MQLLLNYPMARVSAHQPLNPPEKHRRHEVSRVNQLVCNEIDLPRSRSTIAILVWSCLSLSISLSLYLSLFVFLFPPMLATSYVAQSFLCRLKSHFLSARKRTRGRRDPSRGIAANRPGFMSRKFQFRPRKHASVNGHTCKLSLWIIYLIFYLSWKSLVGRF